VRSATGARSFPWLAMLFFSFVEPAGPAPGSRHRAGRRPLQNPLQYEELAQK
jgi:hypothetical protein